WAEVIVVDPDTEQPVAPGERGELWTRSTQNMAGYWAQPDKTVQTLRPDGWLRTGDVAEVRDGFVFLVDRLNDMIISGGENIFPAEVERVLMNHPAVSDVAVVGVPHPRWGETPQAVVRPVAGVDPSES